MPITDSELKQVLQDGKAEDIMLLPTVRQSGGLFTHIIIATAGSARHASALAERVQKAQKQAGEKKSRVEASEEREWVLIDCGDIIVHIMQRAARERYQLEALWGFEGGGD